MTTVLTARQLEAVQAKLATGSTSEAAGRMGISVHTVRHHLREARCRLGVFTTEQAIASLVADGSLEWRDMAMAQQGEEG